MSTFPVASLRRLLRDDRSGHATCDLCGNDIEAEHVHLADVVRRSLRCSCPTCAAGLAGDDPAVRPIPVEVRRLPASVAESVWEGLGAPVGVVFLLLDDDGGWSAHYPGAAGAVGADLDAGQVAASVAGLTDDQRPVPQVQALLLDRRRGRPPTAWIIPVDRCYALIERLRRAWQGVDGGSEAERALATEFAALDALRLGALLGPARRVSDAVLREGQVLYPYRADATKNQWRWTMGVVWPRAWATHPDAEPWWASATFLVHGEPTDTLHLVVRHQHLVHRTTEDGGAGQDETGWDEAALVEHPVTITLGQARSVVTRQLLVAGGTVVDRPAGTTHIRQLVTASVRVKARTVGRWDLLEVRVENTLDDLGEMPGHRDEHLRRALVGTQVLLATDATVGSLRAPEPDSLAAVGQAVSERLWPVQVDEHTALATAMILPEPPTLSSDTVGETGDATEIEEMMALRVRTLLPSEKEAAEATDPFAADVVRRLDGLTPEQVAGLHAELRTPGRSTVVRGSQVVRVGARVRLRPKRTADAMDLALDGRVAVVDAVLEDLDGSTLVRVTVEDDPGADLLRETGRGYHFSPDEVSVLPTTIVAGVGNVFNGDDGFGPAVVAALRERALPTGCQVEDYGIRGVHLAWDLAGHDGRVIVVDAIDLDQPAGTVVLLDPSEVPDTGTVDGHDLQLPAVLARARELGGGSLDVIVVGCVPASVDEGMSLSPAVSAAVGPAVDRIVQLLEEA